MCRFCLDSFVESVDEAALIELLENLDVDQLIRLCGLCPRVGLADEFKLRLQTLAPGLGLPFLRTRVEVRMTLDTFRQN